MLWHNLWKQCGGPIPSGECGCHFRDPSTVDGNLRHIAVSLWHAQTLASVRLSIKSLTGHAYRIEIPLYTSVSNFKSRIHEKFGVAVIQCCIVDEKARQFLHDAAPVGAYMWDLLNRQHVPTDVLTLNLLLP